jgi:cysteine desulfurase / selenocysteine lyase
MHDIQKVIQDFPIISENKEIVFLDSAASSQKPQVVIDRISRYYEKENANIHRGIYALSENATAEFETARKKISNFLHVPDENEIIFTKGTTESINLVAMTWGRKFLNKDSEVVLSVCEHHSNIVPWQILKDEIGFEIKYIPLTDDHRLDVEAAGRLITEKTKLVSIGHVSNVLGVIHPVEKIIELAKHVGARVFLDGAQGVPHLDVDVKKLDCDFYCFSAHKILGPTGVGVLYGKREVLESMPPFHGGGDMIETVALEGSTWADIPHKFEAGTPNIAGVIGTGVAVEYLMSLDRDAALKHDVQLGSYLLEKLDKFEHVKVFVNHTSDWVGVVTFAHDQIHAHDLAAMCDREGVCVRAGHHCAMPLLKELGVSSTLRASPYIYNTKGDMDKLIEALKKAEELFL